MIAAGERLRRLPAMTAVIAVRIYQYTVAPILPGGCRYTPSCSEYMVVALRRFGLAGGLRLGLRRILRCHPWGGAGWDPVPERTERRKHNAYRSRSS